MFSSLFLILLRIKSPIGEVPNIPVMTSKYLQEALKLSQRSVVFFLENKSKIEFAEYGVKKFRDRIDFFKAPSTDAAGYDCPIFPCVVPFQRGKVIETNIAPLQPASFAKWLENVLTPGYVNVSSHEQLSNYLENHQPMIFAVDAKGRPSNVPKGSAVYVVTSELFREFGVDVKKGVYIYRPADRELLSFKGNVEKQLGEASIIDLNSINVSLTKYISGYAVNINDDNASQVEIEILNKLAPKYKDATQMTLLYGKFGETYLKDSELDGIPRPFFFTFISEDIGGGRWIINKPDKVHDIQYIEQFLNNIIAEKEEFTFISEDVPENKEPLKKAVGTTYEEIVSQKDKDIIVAFISSKDKKTLQIIPLLNETAKLLENTHVSIYTIDGSLNDFPESIPPLSEYPEIYYFRADDKQNPIKFKGFKLFERFLTYIKENTSKELDIPSYNKEEIETNIRNAIKALKNN